MDRQILTLLVGPIQESLGVNDTEMGLLHGFTFAAFYAIMGLPIARMIDRGNRPADHRGRHRDLEPRHRRQRPRDRLLAPGRRRAPASPSARRC